MPTVCKDPRIKTARASWARLAGLALAGLLAAGALGAQAPAAQQKPTPHSRRDPFKTLIIPPGSGKGQPLNLPAGKAGLLIDRLQVQGIAIGGPTGPVALVAEGDETYFLRPGDRIYDGVVERLEPSGIEFQRTRALAKGQTVGAEVTRGIVSAGESQ